MGSRHKCFFCATRPSTLLSGGKENLVRVHLPGSPGALEICSNDHASCGFLLLCHLLSIEPTCGDQAGPLGHIENLWVCEAKCAPFLISLQNQVGLYNRLRVEIGETVDKIRQQISGSPFNGAGEEYLDEEFGTGPIDSLRHALAFTEEERPSQLGTNTINWNLLSPNHMPQELYNLINLFSVPEPSGVGTRGIYPSASTSASSNNKFSVKMEVESSEDLCNEQDEFPIELPELPMSPYLLKMNSKLELEEVDLDENDLDFDNSIDPLGFGESENGLAVTNRSLLRQKQEETRTKRPQLKRRAKATGSSSSKSKRRRQFGRQSSQSTARQRPPATCKLCFRVFTRGDSLKYHMRRMHGIGPPLEEKFSCPHCEKTFCKRGNFTQHVRIHEPHEEVHKKPSHSPATCSTCGRTFTRAESLRYHEKSIHGIGGPLERKHICPICDRSYPRSQHLKSHMKSHSYDEDGTNVDTSKPQSTSAKMPIPTKNVQKKIPGLLPLELVEPEPNPGFESDFEPTSPAPKVKITRSTRGRQTKRISYVVDQTSESEADEEEKDSRFNLDPPKDPDYSPAGAEAADDDEEEPEPRKYACSLCPKTFLRSSHLTDHTKSAHDGTEKLVNCHFCEKTFKSCSGRKFHERTIHNLQGCDRPPRSKLHPSRSPRTRHGNPSQCTQCPKICTTEWARRRHELVMHSKQESWPCPEPDCSTILPTIYKLWDHKRTFHVKGPLYTCDYCVVGKSFSSIGRLKKHNRLFHGGNIPEIGEDGQIKTRELPKYRRLKEVKPGEPLTCPDENCTRTFSNKLNLELHVKRIHDRGLIQCKLCTKAMRSEDHMKEHLWLHQERARRELERPERPVTRKPPTSSCTKPDERRIHKCNYCDKMWLRPIDARRHEDAVHKKLLPYLCETCGKPFPRMHGLWMHMQYVHGQTTWTQQLTCEYCPGKTFSTIGWWETHQKKFHGNEPNVQEVTYGYSHS